MKVIAIMQPGYLPWIGFFELMHRADAFVIYDNVKFDKNGWRNRNRIKSATGPLWLTVPVLSANEPRLNEIKIDNRKNWRKKHILSIENNYRKSKFFKDYFPELKMILERDWIYLNELNLELIKYLAERLEIGKEIHIASKISELTEMEKLAKVERLIAICKNFSADVFYEPAGGRDYLEKENEKFKSEGISLIFQNITAEKYSQLYGDFIPNLSVIDLLFNMGKKAKENIINSGKKSEI